MIYHPKTNLEKFGFKIYNLLVENFPQTFYVGGMVRDLLLRKTVTDIDIATEAGPEQVAGLLSSAGVSADRAHQNFGIIIAKNSKHKIEIATFRRDSYGKTRYPKVTFVKNPKTDSMRRDFTVNALYFSPKNGKILDFHGGLKDLKLKNLKFIGDPAKRIKEDPLRIIRAIRFALQLNFKFENKTKLGLEKNFGMINQLTAARVKSELDKILDTRKKQIARAVINHKKFLDK